MPHIDCADDRVVVVSLTLLLSFSTFFSFHFCIYCFLYFLCFVRRSGWKLFIKETRQSANPFTCHKPCQFYSSILPHRFLSLPLHGRIVINIKLQSSIFNSQLDRNFKLNSDGNPCLNLKLKSNLFLELKIILKCKFVCAKYSALAPMAQ